MTVVTQRVVKQFTPPNAALAAFGILENDELSTAGYLSAYTIGWTLAETLSTQPQRQRTWTLLGLSVNLRLGLSLFGGGGAVGFKRWGRLGKLLAGISVRGDLVSNLYGTLLPADMSNFTTIWDGASDPVNIVDANTSPPTTPARIATYSLIQNTFMFPQPIVVGWDTPIQVGLIQTPSLLGMVGGPGAVGIGLVIPVGAIYTLIYDESDRKNW